MDNWIQLLQAVVAGGVINELIRVVAGRRRAAVESEQIVEATAQAAAAEWRQLSDEREGELAALKQSHTEENELIRILQTTIDVMARQVELLALNGKARFMLEQLPDLFIQHDLEGRVLYVTAATAKVMGRTPDEIIGTTSEERKDKSDGASQFHGFRQLVILSGKAYKGEASYQTPEGRRRYEFNIAPFRRAGKVIGTVTVSRDITANYMR